MTTAYTHLISVAQLQQLQAQGAPLMVFDCSFNLFDPAEADTHFAQAHIAGSRQAHLERDLSAASGAPAMSGGRHPLPEREAFAAWLRSQGFDSDMQAIVYDRNGLNFCGRLWWMLKWAGHDAVAVLDGGLQAWQAAGGAVQGGPAPAPARAGNFTLGQPLRRLRSQAEVAAHLTDGTQTLIDGRAAARYRGEVEPLEPAAGHIPGALNRPFGDNLDANGLFKSAQVLRSELQTLLAGRPAQQELVCYCGSGVSTVPNIIALELAGYEPPVMYAGSWSEWTRTPGAQIEKS